MWEYRYKNDIDDDRLYNSHVGWFIDTIVLYSTSKQIVLLSLMQWLQFVPLSPFSLYILEIYYIYYQRRRIPSIEEYKRESAIQFAIKSSSGNRSEYCMYIYIQLLPGNRFVCILFTTTGENLPNSSGPSNRVWFCPILPLMRVPLTTVPTPDTLQVASIDSSTGFS